MTVLGGPAVTSRERKAFTGVGSGLGEGDGESAGVGEGVVSVVGDGLVPAVTRNQMGKTTRIRSKRMKRRNDTRARLVTPGATGSTMPKWAPGSAIARRGRPSNA